METLHETSTIEQEQAFDRWLRYAGWALIGATLAGYLFMGPTSDSSVFGSLLYFDVNQNIIHLVLGVIALAVSGWGTKTLQKYTIGVLGFLFVVASAYSVYGAGLFAPNAWIINVEFPLETLVYGAAGLWAMWVALMPAGPVFVKDAPSA